MKQRGSAGVEYVAAVAVVGVVVAALLTLRPHHVSRTAPVDVIPPIVRLLGRPVEHLGPPSPPRPRPPRPPVARPRPARPARTPDTVLLPEWWRGR